jgi:hypothetical protein
MTTEELYILYRYEVDDTEAPYLWSDTEVFEYMDDAQRRFTELVPCLSDQLSVSVTAGTATVALPERLVEIRRRGYLGTSKSYVTPITMKEADEAMVTTDYGTRIVGGWEDRTGTPEFLITDWATDTGRLVPIPVASETMTLAAYVTPLQTIEDDLVDLEIPSQYHHGLLHWMKKRAYSKNDMETMDTVAEERAEKAWNGFILDSRRRAQVQTRGGGTVKYGGL